MPTTVPAMKAKLGDTDYYILSMKAQELADKVKIPKELTEWADMSIDERYQRDINYSRVKKQIAPYLANDESRFFGAIIVAAMNFDDTDAFEPLSEVTTRGLPGLYRAAADNIGFLTFKGGEVLVPLDGQHRLKAIQFAITGRDEKGKDIAGLDPCTLLAQEDVTVILIRYDSKKARKIFTRVNASARKTTAGQNYVTDDDDVVAVLAREVANKLIGGRLVQYTNSALNPLDSEFTTLSIIYNCNRAIITDADPAGKLKKEQLPSEEKQNLYRHEVLETWELLLKEISVFADALVDKEGTGDGNRCEIRGANLLGKPVTQECLVRAFLRLTGAPTNMAPSEACEKLNTLPWGITEENLKVWDRVLWTGGVGGKIITTQKNRTLATNIIAYLAGEKIIEERKSELLEEYRSLFPDDEREDKELPELR